MGNGSGDIRAGARHNIAVADNHSVSRVAFFGFQLINTSLEPSTSGETGRIKILDNVLREPRESYVEGDVLEAGELTKLCAGKFYTAGRVGLYYCEKVREMQRNDFA